MEKKRIQYIDISKVIGIYLVILGHYIYYLNLPIIQSPAYVLLKVIFLFHMPLFFIISGVLYKQDNFRTILNKTFQQLIKPYFLICFISIAIGILLTYDDFSFKLLVRNIIGVFTGGDLFGKAVLSYSGAMWFCFSLILIKLLFQIAENQKCGRIIHLLLITIGIGVMYIGNKFPLKICPSLVGYVFFYIGYKSKQIIKYIDQMNQLKLLYVLIILSLSFYFISVISINEGPTPTFSINQVRFGKYPFIFLLSGIIGTLCILILSKLIEPIYNNLIMNIANGTIIILGFHKLFYIMLRGHVESYHIIDQLIISLFILIGCTILIYFSKKFFPILLGNRK